LLANAKAHRTVQGGSTITQQLAKNAFLTPERSLRRKGQEAMIALWLELRLSKDEILSRYLSSIYFGDGVYGLGAAARHYFGKPPEQLSIGEAAMLAGIVKAPVDLDPVDHAAGGAGAGPAGAGGHGRDQGDHPPAGRRGSHVAVRTTRADLPVGGYFADWISPQVKSAFDRPGFGEVRVPTTLDSRLQRIVERAVARDMKGAAKAGVGQVAVVAMRPDGQVVAMVGGVNYRKSPFNRAVQARRQPGSAFKLFVYLAALRDGATPDSLVIGDPVTIGGWTPSNYEGGGGRDLTLRDAFAQSNNIIAARIYQQAGGGGGPGGAGPGDHLAAARGRRHPGPGHGRDQPAGADRRLCAVASGKMPVRAYGRPRTPSSGTAPIATTDMDAAEREALLRPAGRGGRGGHRPRRAPGPEGLWQDRHHPGLSRRPVRRLHRRPGGRGLGRQRRPLADEPHGRRRPAGPHLARRDDSWPEGRAGGAGRSAGATLRAGRASRTRGRGASAATQACAEMDPAPLRTVTFHGFVLANRTMSGGRGNGPPLAAKPAPRPRMGRFSIVRRRTVGRCWAV
jgi:penicillin-binding protein 1A